MEVEPGKDPMIRISTEFDCDINCRSQQHASQLISCITKSNDLQTRLFVSRCHNSESVVDAFGRTVLHVAASCGRSDIVKWLVTELGANISTTDRESGWTALHRSLFYGQLSTARILIALGSSLTKRDREGLTVIDIVMKDKLPHVEFVHSGLDDLFTWGSNSNFTLGHENLHRKKVPEQVELFRKKSICIRKVSMSKYHSVFLTDNGQVYTCGHGLGGRLGHGNEHTYMVPHLVEALKKEICIEVGAATNHSVFLMESGTAYSCGLNKYHLLGQCPPPDKCLIPKQVNAKTLKGRQMIGICVRHFHTVFYTKDVLLTCGLNAGQLGHNKVSGESVVSTPRLVSSLWLKDANIVQVTASDAVTIVVTSKGDVFALHEYQCRKIISKWLDIKQVCCSGGHLDHSSDAASLIEHGVTTLTVVLLTKAGKVFVCCCGGGGGGSSSFDSIVIRRCVWSIGRSLFVTDVALGSNIVALVTKDGEAFTGSIKNQTPSPNISKSILSIKDNQSTSDTFNMTLSDLVQKDEIIDVNLERIPLVHRANAIATDQQGTNISVLQSHPNACVTSVPSIRQSEMSQHLATLLADAHLDDCIHDIELQVGVERIPAHRYILVQRSEFFQTRLTMEDGGRMDVFCDEDSHREVASKEEPMLLKVDLHGNPIFIFKQLLEYIYTDSCDFLSPGKQIQFDVNDSSSLNKLENDVKNGNTINVTPVNRKNKKTKKMGNKVNDKQQMMSSKDDKEQMMSSRDVSLNPLETLKEMAREFGIESLVKRLETVKCVNGFIVSNLSRNFFSSDPLRFKQKQHSHLHDVLIESDDGRIVACHKCILVARLEYFRSMFSSTWIEMTDGITLRLPFSGEILEIVIDFLYNDDCRTAQGCDNAELLCNVLVVADQLLIGRLKDQCEVAIAQLLNLRNACELLEFASVYNAPQLAVTAQQFISINLQALLETRSLDVLSDDVMDRLTQYYKNSVEGMDRRRITPYSDWPTIETLERLEKSCLRKEMTKKMTETTMTSSGRKTSVRRRRIRTTSDDDLVKTSQDKVHELQQSEIVFLLDGSVKDDDLMIEEDDLEEINQNPSPHITDEDSLMNATTTDCQSLQFSSSVYPLPATPSCEIFSSSLREIMSEEMSRSVLKSPSSPPSSSTIGGTMVASASLRWPKKLSQKERKRLETTSKTSTVILENNTTDCQQLQPQIMTSPTNPWKSVGNIVKSFKDLMITEKLENEKKLLKVDQMLNKLHQSPTTSSATIASHDNNIKFSWGIGLKSPVSPSISSEPTSPNESPLHRQTSESYDLTSNPTSFSDILRDEMIQTQTLKHSTKKHLSLIQIEEKAMLSFIDYYKAADNVHEYITVERVPATYARPLWAATQRQSSSFF